MIQILVSRYLGSKPGLNEVDKSTLAIIESVFGLASSSGDVLSEDEFQRFVIELKESALRTMFLEKFQSHLSENDDQKRSPDKLWMHTQGEMKVALPISKVSRWLCKFVDPRLHSEILARALRLEKDGPPSCFSTQDFLVFCHLMERAEEICTLIQIAPVSIKQAKHDSGDDMRQALLSSLTRVVAIVGETHLGALFAQGHLEKSAEMLYLLFSKEHSRSRTGTALPSSLSPTLDEDTGSDVTFPLEHYIYVGQLKAFGRSLSHLDANFASDEEKRCNLLSCIYKALKGEASL